jgi:hypothetical protein
MSFLNKAKKHFNTCLTQELQSVEVPELNEQVYFRPVTTFAKLQEITKYYDEGKMQEGLAMGIIMRALDKDGKPMFNKNNMPELMNEVDPKILYKIADAMASAEVKIEEVEKN